MRRRRSGRRRFRKHAMRNETGATTPSVAGASGGPPPAPEGMRTLYHSWLSPFSRKVRVVLGEKGLADRVINLI